MDPLLLASRPPPCGSITAPQRSFILFLTPPSSPPRSSLTSVSSAPTMGQHAPSAMMFSSGGCSQRGGPVLLPFLPWPGGMILTIAPDGIMGATEVGSVILSCRLLCRCLIGPCNSRGCTGSDRCLAIPTISMISRNHGLRGDWSLMDTGGCRRKVCAAARAEAGVIRPAYTRSAGCLVNLKLARL